MAYTANISSQVSNNIKNNLVFDYLKPNAFKFSIKDLPYVAYTCQSANLPSVNIGFAQQPTPFVDIPKIGDKLLYGDFTIRFLIAEDMRNYRELFNWIVALGFPNSYNEYNNFEIDRLNRFPFVKNLRGEAEVVAYSDATLTILNSSNIPKININFKDLFPTSIEALDFDITSSSIEYFVGIASFKYRTFDIQTL